MDFVTLKDIEAARERIAGKVVATPTVLSPSLSRACRRAGLSEARTPPDDGQLQAARRIERHRLAVGRREGRGVTAASTGNHGRGLAHAAKLEGMRAVICMSRLVPENKLSEIRNLGRRGPHRRQQPGRRPGRGRPAGRRGRAGHAAALRPSGDRRRPGNARAGDHGGRAGRGDGSGAAFGRRAGGGHRRRRQGAEARTSG